MTELTREDLDRVLAYCDAANTDLGGWLRPEVQQCVGSWRALTERRAILLQGALGSIVTPRARHVIVRNRRRIGWVVKVYWIKPSTATEGTEAGS